MLAYMVNLMSLMVVKEEKTNNDIKRGEKKTC